MSSLLNKYFIKFSIVMIQLTTTSSKSTNTNMKNTTKYY